MIHQTETPRRCAFISDLALHLCIYLQVQAGADSNDQLEGKPDAEMPRGRCFEPLSETEMPRGCACVR